MKQKTNLIRGNTKTPKKGCRRPKYTAYELGVAMYDAWREEFFSNVNCLANNDTDVKSPAKSLPVSY